MKTLVTYIVELNIAVSAFFLIYYILFRKDKNFTNRRVFLLVIMILSFIIPFLHIQLPDSAVSERTGFILLDELIIVPGSTDTQFFSVSVLKILPFFYFSISLFFLIRLIFGTVRIVISSIRSEKREINSIPVYINKELHASSFFSMIFIDPESVEGSDLEHIIEHERQHVKLWHSADRIFTELIIAFCWVNPVSWILRKAVVVNHEYQADNRVIEQGTDQVSYQLTILNQYIGSASITNQFSNQIKNRITMLNKDYKKGSFWKSILLIPISTLLIFFMACSNEMEADDTNNKKSSDIEATKAEAIEEPAASVEEVFTVVEEMPTFNGGDAAAEFTKYISKNLSYPEKAVEEGISGKVFIQFVVDTKGEVVDAKVVRGADPSLDKEALRVVMSSPAWKPGKQRGKAVKVQFTFPINFVLE